MLGAVAVFLGFVAVARLIPKDPTMTNHPTRRPPGQGRKSLRWDLAEARRETRVALHQRDVYREAYDRLNRYNANLAARLRESCTAPNADVGELDDITDPPRG